MALFNRLKSMLAGNRTDVRARFELLRQAVSGTMSKFYKARDRQSGAIVGLKILDPQKTAFFESRFKGLHKPSEGEIAQALSHPYIVRTLEHGTTTENEPYLVMEFLEGPGLNSLIIAQNTEFAPQRLALLRQAAEALKAVHDAGYIHRDVCPRNFVVTADLGSLKLIDFGLTVPARAEFMQEGNRTGTPNYMAPELVKRQRTDQRLDLFSFGVTAYEMLTFQLPWERGSTGQAAMGHASQPARDILELRPELNPKLAKAIMSCLERNPAQRCSQMAHVLSVLRGLEQESA